jgi:hypothetical protein
MVCRALPVSCALVCGTRQWANALGVYGYCIRAPRNRTLIAGHQAMAEHAYNDPNIGPYEFLYALTHDRSLPLRTRMDAAAKLLWLEHRHQSQVPESVADPVPEPALSEKDKQWAERMKRYGLDPKSYHKVLGRA